MQQAAGPPQSWEEVSRVSWGSSGLCVGGDVFEPGHLTDKCKSDQLH